MKRYTLFTLFLLNSFLGYSQEFQKTFGGMQKENSYQVIATPDKGVFSLGSTESFGAGKSDIYLVKTDSVGNMEWTKTYGGIKDDFGTSIDKTKDNNYVVLGYSLSFTEEYHDICLIKINEKGDVIWSKVYGLDKSEYSTSVQCTSDGGFIILGETISLIGNEKNSDLIVIKTNKDGEVEWSKMYGGKNSDYGYSIREVAKDGYIIGGETNSYGSGEWDFYMLKLKKNGDVVWSKTYGESKSDYGRCALPCPDGGYIIGGNTLNFNAHDYDFCLIKTDEAGNVQWSKFYGGLGTDYLLSMNEGDSKGFIFTGYSNSAQSDSADVCLVYTDYKKGKVHWTRLYGSTMHDYGVSINFSADNEIIIGGSTNGFGTKGEDVFLIKTTFKPHHLTDCNSNYFYPFFSKEALVKVGTGHYQFDLHCEVNSVDFKINNTLTSEQVVCTPEN